MNALQLTWTTTADGAYRSSEGDTVRQRDDVWHWETTRGRSLARFDSLPAAQAHCQAEQDALALPQVDQRARALGYAGVERGRGGQDAWAVMHRNHLVAMNFATLAQAQAWLDLAAQQRESREPQARQG